MHWKILQDNVGISNYINELFSFKKKLTKLIIWKTQSQFHF